VRVRVDALAAAKSELRARVRRDLAALAPARRALEEEVVQAAIQSDPVWARARTVLLYKAVAPEFSVVGLTLAAWRQGKRTLFPRVDGPGRLTLHQVSAWTDLQPGAYGIPEPKADGRPRVPPADVDLAIVPGVAWDAQGHRLGRGGGFYDRLIPELKGPAWGVGFDAQWTATLPVGEWDAQVAKVWLATPLGLL